MTGVNRLLAAVALAGVLGACTPDPTSFKTTTEAGRDINPTDDGLANPVVVRVYSLQNKDLFTSSEFTPLYTTDRKLLAADIVTRDEFEIRPGETKTIQIKDAKNASFLGVLAAFRSIETARWRDTADMKPHEDNVYTVHLELGSVSLQRRKGFWSFLGFS